MASTNDASVIKVPSKRIGGQIKELVKAEVSSELQALLKALNHSLITTLSDKNTDLNNDDQFVGRGPPIRSHIHTTNIERLGQMYDTTCVLCRDSIQENINKESRSRSRSYDSYLDPENYDSFNPFVGEPKSPTLKFSTLRVLSSEKRLTLASKPNRLMKTPYLRFQVP